jgi:hypothetical protein
MIIENQDQNIVNSKFKQKCTKSRILLNLDCGKSDGDCKIKNSNLNIKWKLEMMKALLKLVEKQLLEKSI